MEEGIKANRHKAIDRGRSSRSLMAWKNSESQLASRYGPAPVVAAARPRCTVAPNRDYNGDALYVRRPLTFSAHPLLARLVFHPSSSNLCLLFRCGRLNVTARGNDADSNSVVAGDCKVQRKGCDVEDSCDGGPAGRLN